MRELFFDKILLSKPAQRGAAGKRTWPACRCVAVLLLLTFFLSACATKPATLPPAPLPEAPKGPEAVVIPDGEDLFALAERHLAKSSYSDALAAYQDYLARFPEGPLAEQALTRTLEIYLALAEHDRAVASYKSLLDRFPDNARTAQAGLSLLEALFSAGEYAKLIEQAPAVREEGFSDVQLARKYLLLGHAYLALGFPVNAVGAYDRSYSAAPAGEKQTAWASLKKAVTRLNTSEIMFLLGQYQDLPPAGYLMYQLGLNKIVERQYEDAVVILTSYLEKFPDHEIAPQARQLLAELKRTFFYEQFTIGCLLPLSGRYKPYGTRALNAVAFALSQYTARNSNPLIKIVVKDTGADPDQTARAADALISQKVAAIIGPMVHVETAAAKAQENGIPMVTLTQKDQIVDIGAFVFRNFFTPNMQVKSLVSHVVKNLGLTRFAILYPNERYGLTYMNLFWDEVIAQGGVVAGVESYDPKQTDFAEPIKKLVGLFYDVPEYLKPRVDLIAEMLFSDRTVVEETQKTGRRRDEEERRGTVDFDAVFIPDSPSKAGLLIPQLAYYDISDVYLLGTNLWHSNDLIKMADQYVQRAIIADGFFAESDSENVKAFSGPFAEIYQQRPGFIEAISYDTAMILFELTNMPGIRTRDELKDALLNVKGYGGVTGRTSFTENGDVEKELYLLRIRGEKFIELNARSSR